MVESTVASECRCKAVLLLWWWLLLLLLTDIDDDATGSADGCIMGIKDDEISGTAEAEAEAEAGALCVILAG